MIRDRQLEQIAGADADGEFHLERAEAICATAESIIESNSPSSLALAYDAFRTSLGALLAHQGLRATSTGGHVAYGQAARAQFPGVFDDFENMRRMRHDTEYARSPSDLDVSAGEADEACEIAREACGKVRMALEHLGMWA